MSTTPHPRLFRRRVVKPYARHSAVYAWLRTYHDLIEPRLSSGEELWPRLLGNLARDGHVGRHGEDLSLDSVQRVWKRVCRDVKDAGPKPPNRFANCASRMPKGWRPEEVHPKPAQFLDRPERSFPAEGPFSPSWLHEPIDSVREAMAAASANSPASQPPGKPPEIVLTPEAQAKIDRVMEKFAESDRRKFRFGG